MKKLAFIFLVLCISTYTSGQSKYLTKSGFISFYSHTTMEDIKADNNQVAGILNIESGEMIFTILMKSFKFDQALMEEHFNENYVESDKFPKASFKGRITNLSAIDFKKEGVYNADVEGNISIHGVTKLIKTTGTFEVQTEKIIGKSKFLLDPQDYNIEIPGLVKSKFADKFEITVNMAYLPLKNKM